MIQTEGKTHIKRYLAGFVPAIAQSIAFGIGSKTEDEADTRLQFEAGRVDIALTSLDLVGNRLVYKASLPEDFGGAIYEAAIYSVAADVVAGEFGSRLISGFDSVTEEWQNPANATPGTFDSVSSRIGSDSLVQTGPSSAGSVTHQLAGVELDLTGYSEADIFSFAFAVANGGQLTSIRFRFMTDASNYYDFVFGPQTNGYKVYSVTKSSATVTGTPDWARIGTVQVISTFTSASGTAGTVRYDGIRIEDADTVNPEYVMVAREVLPLPFIKEEGQMQEIEFSVDIVL